MTDSVQPNPSPAPAAALSAESLSVTTPPLSPAATSSLSPAATSSLSPAATSSLSPAATSSLSPVGGGRPPESVPRKDGRTSAGIFSAAWLFGWGVYLGQGIGLEGLGALPLHELASFTGLMAGVPAVVWLAAVNGWRLAGAAAQGEAIAWHLSRLENAETLPQRAEAMAVRLGEQGTALAQASEQVAGLTSGFLARLDGEQKQLAAMAGQVEGHVQGILGALQTETESLRKSANVAAEVLEGQSTRLERLTTRVTQYTHTLFSDLESHFRVLQSASNEAEQQAERLGQTVTGYAGDAEAALERSDTVLAALQQAETVMQRHVDFLDAAALKAVDCADRIGEALRDHRRTLDGQEQTLRLQGEQAGETLTLAGQGMSRATAALEQASTAAVVALSDVGAILERRAGQVRAVHADLAQILAASADTLEQHCARLQTQAQAQADLAHTLDETLRQTLSQAVGDAVRSAATRGMGEAVDAALAQVWAGSEPRLQPVDAAVERLKAGFQALAAQSEALDARWRQSLADREDRFLAVGKTLTGPLTALESESERTCAALHQVGETATRQLEDLHHAAQTAIAGVRQALDAADGRFDQHVAHLQTHGAQTGAALATLERQLAGTLVQMEETLAAVAPRAVDARTVVGQAASDLTALQALGVETRSGVRNLESTVQETADLVARLERQMGEQQAALRGVTQRWQAEQEQLAAGWGALAQAEQAFALRQRHAQAAWSRHFQAPLDALLRYGRHALTRVEQAGHWELLPEIELLLWAGERLQQTFHEQNILAAADDPTLVVVRQPFAVEDWLQHVQNRLATRFELKGISLDVALAKSAVRVESDFGKLLTGIVKLIENIGETLENNRIRGTIGIAALEQNPSAGVCLTLHFPLLSPAVRQIRACLEKLVESRPVEAGFLPGQENLAQALRLLTRIGCVVSLSEGTGSAIPGEAGIGTADPVGMRPSRQPEGEQEQDTTAGLDVTILLGPEIQSLNPDPHLPLAGEGAQEGEP